MQTIAQDWVAKWAMYSPHKPAVKEYETGRSLTYGELNRLANRLARHLSTTYGIQKGDRIALLAENCNEYIILFAVAQKTGCILVPMNYRLAGAEIDYLIHNSEPSLFIVESKFQHLLDAAPAAAAVPSQWTFEALADFCHPATQTDDDQPFPLVPVDDDDPVFILYTSGTTGFPKGAIYTHKMLFWNSINTSMSLIVNSESRTVNVMPPFHTGGWNVLTTPFLHHGGYTCLTKKFDPATVLRLLEQERVTLFMGVPTMLKMLADEPEFRGGGFFQPALHHRGRRADARAAHRAVACEGRTHPAGLRHDGGRPQPHLAPPHRRGAQARLHRAAQFLCRNQNRRRAGAALCARPTRRTAAARPDGHDRLLAQPERLRRKPWKAAGSTPATSCGRMRKAICTL
jgi:acyl-CoA synthetase (AMP-forming)/AMP-acid ligase II